MASWHMSAASTGQASALRATEGQEGGDYLAFTLFGPRPSPLRTTGLLSGYLELPCWPLEAE